VRIDQTSNDDNDAAPATKKEDSNATDNPLTESFYAGDCMLFLFVSKKDAD
jgi:hypothetical protein